MTRVSRVLLGAGLVLSLVGAPASPASAQSGAWRQRVPATVWGSDISHAVELMINWSASSLMGEPVLNCRAAWLLHHPRFERTSAYHWGRKRGTKAVDDIGIYNVTAEIRLRPKGGERVYSLECDTGIVGKAFRGKPRDFRRRGKSTPQLDFGFNVPTSPSWGELFRYVPDQTIRRRDWVPEDEAKRVFRALLGGEMVIVQREFRHSLHLAAPKQTNQSRVRASNLVTIFFDSSEVDGLVAEWELEKAKADAAKKLKRLRRRQQRAKAADEKARRRVWKKKAGDDFWDTPEDTLNETDEAKAQERRRASAALKRKLAGGQAIIEQQIQTARAERQRIADLRRNKRAAIAARPKPGAWRQLTAYRQNGRWGFRAPNGRVAISPRYRWASSKFQHGYAVVRAESGLGLISASGRWVLQPSNRDLKIVGASRFAINDGTDSNNPWRFVDASGGPIGKERISAWRKFHGGVAGVQMDIDRRPNFVDPKWGLMDAKGRFILHPRYGNIGEFKNGRAKFSTVLQTSGRCNDHRSLVEFGEIDQKGKVVAGPHREMRATPQLCLMSQ